MKDELLDNLVKQEYLSPKRWDSNLQTLIPPNFEYFESNNHKTWYVESPTQFFQEEEDTARYVVLVRWKAEIDSRGVIRLIRLSGWHRSPEVGYYDRLEKQWLQGEARKEFVKNKLLPRFKRAFGIKKMKNLKLSRYRFNLACLYPDYILAGLDCHHKNIKNEKAFKLIREDLDKSLYQDWCEATDDRPQNIEVLTRAEHSRVHCHMNENRFIFHANTI